MAVLALVWSGAMSACDCGGTVMSVSARVEVDPAELDFGPVDVGGEARLFVEVTNVGRGTLEIERIAITRPSKGPAGEDELFLDKVLTTNCRGRARAEGDTSIEPDACARFEVRYAPSAAHDLYAEITIDSNDTDSPALLIPVIGSGVTARARLCVLTPDGEERDEACTQFDAADSAQGAKLPVVAFGPVPVGSSAERVVRVHNDGVGTLLFNQVSASGHDFSVSGLTEPVRVPHGASWDVTAVFEPTGDGQKSGELSFRFGGEPGRPEVTLPMTAEAQGPKLCIDPAEGLDFGAVTLGSQRTLSFAVQNCGFAPFDLQAIGFVEDGLSAPMHFSFDSPADSSSYPYELLAGESMLVDVNYSPGGVATNSGTFTVDAGFASETVRVTGSGAPAACSGNVQPQARVRVRNGSLDITSTASNPGVEPLTNVTFDGSGSTVPRGGALYTWRLVSQPTNGTQFLVPSGSSSSSVTNLYAELDGDYVVELVVTDMYGCDSSPQLVTLHVAPSGKVHIQLTWPQNYGDLDLHFVGPGGTFRDAQTNTDCFYRNCKLSDPSFPYRIDWGFNNLARPDYVSTNDPTLDIDELWGYGPENITHDLPFDGTYQVIVHYYCSRPSNAWTSASSSYGSATPNVRIYANGRMVGQPYTKALTQRQRWVVARVVVSNAGQTIQVLPGPDTGVAEVATTAAGQSCSDYTY